MATRADLDQQHREALQELFDAVNEFAKTTSLHEAICIVNGTLEQVCSMLADGSRPDDQARSVAGLYIGMMLPLIGQAHAETTCDQRTNDAWNELIFNRLSKLNSIRDQLQAAGS